MLRVTLSLVRSILPNCSPFPWIWLDVHNIRLPYWDMQTHSPLSLHFAQFSRSSSNTPFHLAVGYVLSTSKVTGTARKKLLL